MSSNLLAARFLPASSTPIYLAALFGSGLLLSCLLWAFMNRQHDRQGLQWGALLGLLNVACTISILSALESVSGTVFFAAVGVVTLMITTLTALLFWRERAHRWGWLGLGLAVVAVPLLILK